MTKKKKNHSFYSPKKKINNRIAFAILIHKNNITGYPLILDCSHKMP